MKNDDFRVCDKCYWFEVHPSGVSETCHLMRLDKYGMRPDYTEERINGEKNTCKGFKPIPAEEMATFGGMSVSKDDVKKLIKFHKTI